MVLFSLIIVCLQISVCVIWMGGHVCPSPQVKVIVQLRGVNSLLHCHVGSRDWAGIIGLCNKHVSLVGHLQPSSLWFPLVEIMLHINTHTAENSLLLCYHWHLPLFFRIGDQVAVLCKFPFLPSSSHTALNQTISNGTISGRLCSKFCTVCHLGISFINHQITTAWLVPIIISTHWWTVIHFKLFSIFLVTEYTQPSAGHFNHPSIQVRGLCLLAMLCSYQGSLSMGSFGHSTWSSTATTKDSCPLLPTSPS